MGPVQALVCEVCLLRLTLVRSCRLPPLLLTYCARHLAPLPPALLPALQAHESASVQDTTAAWEEERPVSK